MGGDSPGKMKQLVVPEPLPLPDWYVTVCLRFQLDEFRQLTVIVRLAGKSAHVKSIVQQLLAAFSHDPPKIAVGRPQEATTVGSGATGVTLWVPLVEQPNWLHAQIRTV